jgi:hypothetical protein
MCKKLRQKIADPVGNIREHASPFSSEKRHILTRASTCVVRHEITNCLIVVNTEHGRNQSLPKHQYVASRLNGVTFQMVLVSEPGRQRSLTHFESRAHFLLGCSYQSVQSETNIL